MAKRFRARSFRHPLSVALAAIATATLGGCYYGDVYGTSYASGGDCISRYGANYYDYDGYAYDDGYGYDCYNSSDYGAGFVNIGFGGGWYDNYYYPGSGLWLFDSYNNRYPLRGQYLNYWGGRRAWWKYHGGRGDGHWNGPGRGNGDGRYGTRPPAPGTGNGAPPSANNPGRPDRPGAGRPQRPPQGDGNYARPRPPRGNTPATEPGEVFNAPPVGQRPPRNWTPRNPEAGRTPQRAPTGRPDAYRPAPTQQAAPSRPVERSAPPAVRSAPEPRSAPHGRAPRVDRPNGVREE